MPRIASGVIWTTLSAVAGVLPSASIPLVVSGMATGGTTFPLIALAVAGAASVATAKLARSSTVKAATIFIRNTIAPMLKDLRRTAQANDPATTHEIRDQARTAVGHTLVNGHAAVVQWARVLWGQGVTLAAALAVTIATGGSVVGGATLLAATMFAPVMLGVGAVLLRSRRESSLFDEDREGRAGVINAIEARSLEVLTDDDIDRLTGRYADAGQRKLDHRSDNTMLITGSSFVGLIGVALLLTTGAVSVPNPAAAFTSLALLSNIVGNTLMTVAPALSGLREGIKGVRESEVLARLTEQRRLQGRSTPERSAAFDPVDMPASLDEETMALAAALDRPMVVSVIGTHDDGTGAMRVFLQIPVLENKPLEIVGATGPLTPRARAVLDGLTDPVGRKAFDPGCIRVSLDNKNVSVAALDVRLQAITASRGSQHGPSRSFIHHQDMPAHCWDHNLPVSVVNENAGRLSTVDMAVYGALAPPESAYMRVLCESSGNYFGLPYAAAAAIGRVGHWDANDRIVFASHVTAMCQRSGAIDPELGLLDANSVLTPLRTYAWAHSGGIPDPLVDQTAARVLQLVPKADGMPQRANVGVLTNIQTHEPVVETPYLGSI